MMDAILAVKTHGCPERKSPMVRRGSNLSESAWPQPGGRAHDGASHPIRHRQAMESDQCRLGCQGSGPIGIIAWKYALLAPNHPPGLQGGSALCPRCEGPRKVIALTERLAVVRQILDHVGLLTVTSCVRFPTGLTAKGVHWYIPYHSAQPLRGPRRARWPDGRPAARVLPGMAL